MKYPVIVMLSFFFLIGFEVFAADMEDLDDASSAQWEVKELEDSAHLSTEEFKKDKGQKLYDAILGYSVEKNAQGTAANIVITYKEAGKKKTQSYFCHVHNGAIDCH